MYFFSDSGDESNDDGIEEETPYHDLLHELSKKWLSLELKHRCSLKASDEFWQLGKDFFPKLHKAKLDAMVYRDVPQFTSQRRRLYKSEVPTVNHEIGYKNKETQETIVWNGEKTPVSRFNPRHFEKLYEVATVEVIYGYRT